MITSSSSTNQKNSRLTIAFVVASVFFFVLFEIKQPAREYSRLKASLFKQNGTHTPAAVSSVGGVAAGGGLGAGFGAGVGSDIPKPPNTNTGTTETGSVVEGAGLRSASAPTTFVKSALPVTDKVAAIIENRPLNTLIPLMLHFAAVLGPTWPVVLYTSPEHLEEMASAPALVRMSHQIEVRALPNDTIFNTHDSVSIFLTKPWFWENLAPAEHVLMFQADSIICGNADASVDDFLEFDFVGAPIAEGLGRGYNGGLSIRNRRKILRIANEYNWEEEWTTIPPGSGYNYAFEDQWFVFRLSKFLHSRLPSQEVAQLFSVETMWAEKPVGFHQIARWQKSRMAEVEEWCPEVRLTIGPTFG